MICDDVHAYGGGGVYVTVTNRICIGQYYKAVRSTCGPVRIAVTQPIGFDTRTNQLVVSHYKTTDLLIQSFPFNFLRELARIN